MHHFIIIDLFSIFGLGFCIKINRICEWFFSHCVNWFWCWYIFWFVIWRFFPHSFVIPLAHSFACHCNKTLQHFDCSQKDTDIEYWIWNAYDVRNRQFLISLLNHALQWFNRVQNISVKATWMARRSTYHLTSISSSVRWLFTFRKAIKIIEFTFSQHKIDYDFRILYISPTPPFYLSRISILLLEHFERLNIQRLSIVKLVYGNKITWILK